MKRSFLGFESNLFTPIKFVLVLFTQLICLLDHLALTGLTSEMTSKYREIIMYIVKIYMRTNLVQLHSLIKPILHKLSVLVPNEFS